MDLTWRDFYRSPYLLFLPFMLVVGLYVELAPSGIRVGDSYTQAPSSIPKVAFFLIPPA